MVEQCTILNSDLWMKLVVVIRVLMGENITNNKVNFKKK